MVLIKVPKALIKVYLKRYPIQNRIAQYNILYRWSWVQPILEELHDELFPKETETTEEIQPTNTEPVSLHPAAGVQFFDSPYKRYRCTQNEPLGCNKTLPLDKEETRIKSCSLCGFPTLLPEKQEIRGQLGSYRIERYIGRRGLGRLYAATQLGVNQPVIIKEYVLPTRYFNTQETQLQKQLFKNLAGISLADGRVQDLRFVQPMEAIADDLEERCYLVMDERYNCSTLNHGLTYGALSAKQVRVVLNQVLQTLEFLHGQKFRLPTGQVQNGVGHGNLSLDTLLMVGVSVTDVTPSKFTQENLDFFIYLCNSGLWEYLFEPLLAQSPPKKKSEDLVSLGYIAFYLLAGKVVTDIGEPLDPRNAKHWQGVERLLKEFILRLMEIELPFESAATARQELLKLPQAAFAPPPDLQAETETEPQQKFPRLLLLLLSILGLGVVGGLAWLLLPKPQLSTATGNTLKICCLKDVGAIPTGKYTYTSTNNGIWEYILKERDLIQKGQTLEARINNAQPKLNLVYQTADSTEVAIAKVESGQAEFAIAPLIQPLPPSLDAQVIAYDGLAVLVAFSYSQREKGLPEKLKGHISLEQLRQLYGGQVSNWQELGATALQVNLYKPANKEIDEVFAAKVLKDTITSSSPHSERPESLPEIQMMRSVIRDFESRNPKVGGIAYSSLSKIVGQCSVYPLAIEIPGQQPVQPLILDNGKSIDPTTDLCDRKGSYHPSVELLKTGRYPLAYPIAVIYPRDNDRPPIGEKFAEMLKTREGQRLLSQTGLVPLE